LTDYSLSAAGVSVVVDLEVGHIADFTVESDGRVLRPLHRAPWIDEQDLPDGIAPGLARLSGDFLCAPFSRSDIEEAPGHGWPANSPWDVVSDGAFEGGRSAVFRLRRRVMGAVVEKILTLHDGHPFLYQEHRFIGGKGEIPVAHHVMGIMRVGGRLSFSAKRFAETPEQSLEPDPARGRYQLAYPARSEDLHRFPTNAGGFADLADYNPADRREDFVTLVEADGNRLGWTALARHDERDLLLVLKDPRELPVTMLWYSNGGRDYAPWNGRHVGVLGIEDGRTAVGHRQSIGDNSLKRAGVATTFVLDKDRSVSFRHVLGVTGQSDDAGPPQAADIEPGRLRLHFCDGNEKHIRFDSGFLAPAE
jgi:hypothetical protein